MFIINHLDRSFVYLGLYLVGSCRDGFYGWPKFERSRDGPKEMRCPCSAMWRVTGWLWVDGCPSPPKTTLLPPCDSWHLVQSNRSNLGVQKTKRTATMTLFRKSNSFLKCSSLFPIIIKLWNMFQLSLSSSMLSIDPVLFHLQMCQVPGLSIHLPPDPKQHAPECSGSPPAI